MTSNALKKMTQARIQMLMSKPLFSSCMELGIVADNSQPTACTDGKTIAINEEWVDGLTLDETVGLVAHETAHLLAGHLWRRGNRDADAWNIACDHVIDWMLVEAGFTLPNGGHINPDWQGKSAEQIYPLVVQEKEDGKQYQPGAGDFTDGPEDEEPTPGEMTTEEKWQARAEVSAMMAEKMKPGTMAGGLAETLEAERRRDEGWRNLTKRWVQHTLPANQSWTRPDRRYVAQGIYLPGLNKQNTGRIVIFVDTSGSTDLGGMREKFAGHISALMATAKPKAIDVVYVDTQVQGEEEFRPGDEIILNARGGGGTAFQPAFDWLTEQRANGHRYVGAIYLTDLDSRDRDRIADPGIPFLWVVTESTHLTGPFGTTVRFEEDY